MPLDVHLGAHRTGTSSFQMMLAENRDLLAQAGFDIAYPGRDDIPQGDLRLKLPDPRNLKQWEAKFLPAAAAELQLHSSDTSHAMILSEENIPGRMIHFPSGQFYPAAEARFQTLAAAAGETLEREAWQQIIAEHRDDKESRGVSEFTKRKTRILKGRYQEHLDEIAKMPAVLLLR